MEPIVIIQNRNFQFVWGDKHNPSKLSVSLEEPCFLLSYLLDPFIAVVHWVFRIGIGERAIVLHFRESCDGVYSVHVKECRDPWFTKKIVFVSVHPYKAALDLLTNEAKNDMGEDAFDDVVFLDQVV